MKNPLAIIKNLLYILQVEEYDLSRFWRWLKTHESWTDLEKKKELVWTTKARTLFFLAIIIWVSFVGTLIFLFWQKWGILILFVSGLTIVIITAKPLLAISVIIASLLLEPLVTLVKIIIISRAKQKRAQFPNLKVVGISGSFGKTSVKEILARILSQKYNVLNTPENINTLIGIARLILRELKPEHQILIAEIGAYRVGDTRAVAQLIKPQLGILTGLNEQHLERFGRIENIIATESGLLEELSQAPYNNKLSTGQGSVAILNRDDLYWDKTRTHVPERVREIDLSLKEGHAGNLKIESLEITEKGSKFILKDDVQSHQLQTKLLGKHNIANILFAILTARELGMELGTISQVVRTIEAPPHRLQPIYRTNDIIILDDSYNVNPDGAKAALEVLSLFKGRRKIVLTHGLVELGPLEAKIHQEFGQALTKVADIVILAGPKANMIEKSLREGKYPKYQIIKANDISDASQKLKQIAKPKDVILIQTDLPDSYG